MIHISLCSYWTRKATAGRQHSRCLIEVLAPPFLPPRTTYPSSWFQVKEAYDQHAHDPPSLSAGTVVRIPIDKEKNLLSKGKVIKKCKVPRSYLIMNEKGSVVRRNGRHLIPSREPFELVKTYDNLQDLWTANDNHLSRPTTTSRSVRTIRTPSRYTDFDMSG